MQTRWLLAVILISVSCCSGKKGPNIVLIVVDDLGFNDVGYNGHTTIKTPTINRLASEGVRLNNYYVQPVCTPSRSQLLSGRYQTHTGLQHLVIWPCQASGLPLEMPTLPDKLKEVGYSTHMVGKWHLGYAAEAYTPLRRGFDSFFGFLNGAEDYFTYYGCYLKPMVWTTVPMNSTNTSHWYCGTDIRDDKDNAIAKYNGQYSTHVYTDRAIDIIKRHRKRDYCHSPTHKGRVIKCNRKPMFLYLSYQGVHSPLEAPASYVSPYSNINDTVRRIHAGMVAVVDEGIANVTKALRQYGLSKNTLVIVTTDNGGETINGGNNWPLRGMKISNWEGGVRGVGLIHSEDKSLLKRVKYINNELIHISDWFPTLVRLAGGSTGSLPLDGYDVWDTLSAGKPSPRKELLHNIDPLWPPSGQIRPNSPFDNRVQAAVRVGKWKLLTGDPYNGGWIAPPETPSLVTVPDPPRTVGNHTKNIWLFDITADPLEQNDLSDSYPEIVDQLLARLAHYNETAVPVNYPKDDPRCDPANFGGFWTPWLPDP